MTLDRFCASKSSRICCHASLGMRIAKGSGMKPMSIGLKLSAAAHCALFAVFSMFLALHPGFHSGWRLGAFAGAVGLTLLSILFARKFKGSASRPLAIHPVATRKFNGSASRPPVIHPVAIGSIITFGISVLLYLSVWRLGSRAFAARTGTDHLPEISSSNRKFSLTFVRPDSFYP